MVGWKFIHRKHMSRAFCFLKGGELIDRGIGRGGGWGGGAERFCKSMGVWMLLQPKL